MKKIVFAILSCVLIFTLYSCSGENEKIILAFTGPLSGDQAVTGIDMFRGAKLAVNELNKKGGILGKQIELVEYDDKAQPKEAVTIAQLIANNDEIIAVVGHLNSGCSKAALPVYSQKSIAMITPVSTDDGLSEMGHNNFFRMPLKNSLQGKFAAEYSISKLGFNNFYIIDDGSPYGMGISDEFEKAVEDMGGNLIGRDQVAESERNFRQLLTKLENNKIDLVYLGIMYPQAGPLIKQAKEMNLETNFMGGDGLFGEKLLDFPTDGAYVTFIAPLEAKTQVQKTFFEEFRKTFNEPVNSYAPLAYDAVMIIAKGISEVGKIDREELVKKLHDDNFVYEGVTGNVKFDKNGDSIDRISFLYQVDNDQFVLSE